MTLSAYETGLGANLGGEGLLGLTRAFQYAGARSIVESLWQVSDESTAELMVRFYGHLVVGLSKDEALRAGQLELLQAPVERKAGGPGGMLEATDPFHWAAFELIGD